jgi:hypothetical protein
MKSSLLAALEQLQGWSLCYFSLFLMILISKFYKLVLSKFYELIVD